MKKLFILIFLCSLATIARAQNPVIISQPYKFQKWVTVLDSLTLPNMGYGPFTGHAAINKYGKLVKDTTHYLGIADSVHYLTKWQFQHGNNTTTGNGTHNGLETFNLTTIHNGGIELGLTGAAYGDATHGGLTMQTGGGGYKFTFSPVTGIGKAPFDLVTSNSFGNRSYTMPLTDGTFLVDADSGKYVSPWQFYHANNRITGRTHWTDSAVFEGPAKFLNSPKIPGLNVTSVLFADLGGQVATNPAIVIDNASSHLRVSTAPATSPDVVPLGYLTTNYNGKADSASIFNQFESTSRTMAAKLSAPQFNVNYNTAFGSDNGVTFGLNPSVYSAGRISVSAQDSLFMIYRRGVVRASDGYHYPDYQILTPPKNGVIALTSDTVNLARKTGNADMLQKSYTGNGLLLKYAGTAGTPVSGYGEISLDVNGSETITKANGNTRTFKFPFAGNVNAFFPNAATVHVADRDTVATFYARKDSTIVYLPTMSSMIAYSGKFRAVFVTISGQGGLFYYSATGTDDNGITYPATGLGSGHWIRQRTHNNEVNANWFVTDNTGATDVTSQLQAAFNALPSTGSTINLSGQYLTAGGITVSQSYVRTVGDATISFNYTTGKIDTIGTIIFCNSPTATALTYTGIGTTRENFSLINNSATTPSAGFGISIPNAGWINDKNVSIIRFYKNETIDKWAFSTLVGMHWINPILTNLVINNSTCGNCGDNNIISSSFSTDSEGIVTSLDWQGGDGLKLINDKFNPAFGGHTLIDIDVAHNGSQLQIDNCSFESFKDSGIKIHPPTGFNEVLISNSIFNTNSTVLTGFPVSLDKVTNASISPNIFKNNGANSNVAISVTNSNVVNVSVDNVFQGFTTNIASSGNTASNILMTPPLYGGTGEAGTITGIPYANGLSPFTTATLATGTAGTAFGLSQSGSTFTFNLPAASTTANGTITTGAQILTGNKSWNGNTRIQGLGGSLVGLVSGGLDVTTAALDALGHLDFNIYYNGGYKYKTNGYGNFFYQTSTGDLQFSHAVNNTSGVSAAATEVLDWQIKANGDLVPNTTNARNIGDATHYVNNAYITTLGGTPTITLTNATGLPTTGLNANAVTYAKIQASSATARLLGTGASGTAFQEITLGSNLNFTGTTINWTAPTVTNLSNRTTVADAAYTQLAGDFVIAYTSLTAARIVTLIAISDKQQVIIKDEAGTAGTNNITINAPAGKTIDGVSSKVINTNYGFLKLYYISSSGNYVTY